MLTVSPIAGITLLPEKKYLRPRLIIIVITNVKFSF